MILLNWLKENWKVYNILLVMLFSNYILSSNFQKKRLCLYDSDGTQTLINAKDRGWLWRVNETVQNIFIECEKIFRSLSHRHFA